MDKAIQRINGLLETYMGINDAELGKLKILNILKSMMIIIIIKFI